MSKVLESKKLTDTLTISKCTDGYWLYDYTRSMNLSMKAETKEDAFVEALTYYQERLKTVEEELKKLNNSVDNFINSVSDNDDD